MVANSSRRLGRRILKKDLRYDAPVTVRRPGTVQTVDAATGLATVLVSGDDEPVPGIKSDSNYYPVPNDRVWLDIADGDVMITGKLGNSPAALAGGRYAEVAASEVRGDSVAYGPCTTTPGPAVTVLVGETGLLEVVITAEITATDSADGGSIGVALSGANTVAAVDTKALRFQPKTTNAMACMSRIVRFDGLTPGQTTVTLVYRDLSGTSVTYAQREIIARPH